MPNVKASFVIFISVASFMFGAQSVYAQATAVKEKVSYKAGTLIGGDTTVSGDLTIPAGAAGKSPAVIVIHSAAGFEDSTRGPYVAALNEAGIATLELNLFSNGGRPPASSMNLPHVYGALINLANDPRIDPARISVMGFSIGGMLSMFTASSQLTKEYTGGKYQFAAHLPLYPVCWAHLATAEGKKPVYKKSTYEVLTDAPVHIFAGSKDDYDDPDTCQKFVQAIPEPFRQHVGLTVYPDAYHGWDTPANRSYYDRSANKGRGGNVMHSRNPEVAEKSKAFTVEFFKSSFAMK